MGIVDLIRRVVLVAWAANVGNAKSDVSWIAPVSDTVGRRWVIAYAGDSGRMAYSVSDFISLVSVLDTAGKPQGWLCDGAVFVVIRSPAGHNFATWLGQPYATGDDWEEYLTRLFEPGGPLARLDAAVAAVTKAVGPPTHPFAVSLVSLYPEPQTGHLQFLGRGYDLGTVEGRTDVVDAYLKESIQRWAKADLQSVAFHSFYWLHESVHGEEERLVQGVSRRVHGTGKRFLWVPFYTAWGVDRWKSMGFDEAWLQPNYFFHPEVSLGRLDSAVTRAQTLEMGLEIEFDGRLFTQSPVYGGRLKPYLDALARSPYFQRQSIMIFEGSGALPRLSKMKDPIYRQLYCDLALTLNGSVVRC